ncbi:ABC transporter permease [Treponema parvum]|uniref:ABC transporter permease n=1 Tax=Treponema parvum TaxID=138851 RepID=UPI001AEC49AB|nr:ABC transporter permease [Treponema parvum]QTQ15828.1 ABC transporter permease [Treponema parvum]
MKYKFSEQTRKMLPMYAVGAVFVVVNLILDPSVLRNWRSTCAFFLQFAPLMACAMAQTCILLTGGIDLSIGMTVSMMTTILATTMGDGPLGIAFGVVVTLLSGAAVGLIMGSVVTFARIPAIIVTLAFSYVWKGVTLFILPRPGGYIPKVFTRFFSGRAMIPGAALVLIVAVVVWKLIKNSRLGVAIYAVGDNPKVAYANGINVNRSRLTAYALSGMFVAVSALLLVGQIGCGDPTIGPPFQMNSIAAAVLGGVAFTGGVGMMRGALIGAFINTSLLNILFFAGASPYFQKVVQGFILIAVIGVKAIEYYRKGDEE